MKSKTAKRPAILSTNDWRTQKAVGAIAGIGKAAILQRDGESVSFIASSATADRYGDTIDQKGWETANFEANPVLLWAHSHSTPPVGKVGKLDKTGDLTAKEIEFTPAELHKFGAEVGGMVKAGFLNAVSVGFMPLEWEERRDEEGRFLGYHFKRMELLEISVVPVPANPEAVQLHKSFGSSLSAWLADVRDDAQPIERAFRAEAEATLKAAEEIAQRAQDAGDAEGFAELVSLMREFVEGQKRVEREIRELRRRFDADDAEALKTVPAAAVETPPVAESAPITDAEKASPLGGFLKSLTRG